MFFFFQDFWSQLRIYQFFGSFQLSKIEKENGKPELYPLKDREIILKNIIFNGILTAPVIGLSIYLGKSEEFVKVFRKMMTDILV